MNTAALLFGIFALMVFPGFLFATVAGMAASWIDRKVTARVQYRVGPPFFQPLYDILKLLAKETILPRGASKWVFLGAPAVALAAISLFSAMVGVAVIWPEKSFSGDIIVALYLLTIPSLCIIMGGAASGNPIASLGASREIKMLLGYEIPFLIAVAAVLILNDGTLKLGELMRSQSTSPLTWPWVVTTVLAMIAAMIGAQAKLGLVPFDAAEAETEIMGGILVEYSGAPLALFRLTKIMMLWAVPFFIVAVFWGASFATPVEGIVTVFKYVALLVVVVLARNTNPRLRIQHARGLLWELAGLAAVAGAIVALLWR